MNNITRLDWLCRLRSLLREPYMKIALGKDRVKFLPRFDEALSDEIERLMFLCYGQNHRFDQKGSCPLLRKVTNKEEAKEYPIMKKEDADKIAEAFKRLRGRR